MAGVVLATTATSLTTEPPAVHLIRSSKDTNSIFIPFSTFNNPHFRCDALDFKLSKSHKKILKRMSKFLRDGVRDKQDSVPDNNASGEGDGSSKETEFLLSRNTKINTISKEGRRAVAVDAASDKIEIKPDVPGKQERIEVENSQETTKGHCKKAKLMRLERKQAKLALKGESMEVTPKTQKCPEKSLEEFLSEEGKNVLLKLEVL